jgi:hypothetical protein
MPYCTICKANGESDDVCGTHNAAAFTKCPYHVRYPDPATRKQPKPDSDDDDSALDPELSQALPKTPNSKSVASVARRGTSSELSGLTARALVEKLYNGELSKQSVKQQLSLMVVDAEADAQAKLLNTIKTVDLYEPDTASKSESASEAHKEIAKLQSRHGRLSGTFIATHRRILHDLHIKRKSDGTKQVYALESGEHVVACAPGEQFASAAILQLVLVDFLYVCMAYMYLTATEAHALQKWVAKRMYLHPNEWVVTQRCVERFLALSEASPCDDVGAIIKSEASNILVEERDIARPKPDPPPTPNPSGGQRVRLDRGNLTPGDPKLAVPWPRAGICWQHTNNSPCTNMVNGKCKFAEFHGICGKQYTVNGVKHTCNGNHRATNCDKQST